MLKIKIEGKRGEGKTTLAKRISRMLGVLGIGHEVKCGLIDVIKIKDPKCIEKLHIKR